MKINIIIAIVLVVLFLYCISKIKNAHMDFKNGLPWLIGIALLLVLDLVPSIVEKVTDWVGIELPINLLFLVAIGLCMVLIFRQSMEISKLKEEHKKLAQEMAILKEKKDDN